MNKKKYQRFFKLSVATLAMLSVSLSFSAANFTIKPATNYPYLSRNIVEGTVSVFYSVTNNTSSTRSGYTVQGLSSSVTQNTSNSSFCSNPITLTAHDSCILQLDIMRPVQANFAICKGSSCTKAEAAINITFGQVVSKSQQILGQYANLLNDLKSTLAVWSMGSIDQNFNYTVTEPYEFANINSNAVLYNYQINDYLTPGSSYFLTDSVDAYSVEYTTPCVNFSSICIASGLVLIPKNITPRGVVVYHHPTTPGKNQVPSCLGSLFTGYTPVSANPPAWCNITPMDNNGANMFASFAASYVARGFAVVSSDYLGQGSDYNNVHPYIAYSDTNSLSNLYMLPVMRTILQDNYNVPLTVALPMLLTGFSEGAGYTMRTSQLSQSTMASFLTNNNIQLVQTSPQEGAYSLLDEISIVLINKMDGFFNCGSVTCSNDDMVSNGAITPAVAALNIYQIGDAALSASFLTTVASYLFTAIGTYTYPGEFSSMMNPAFWQTIPTSAGIATTQQLYSGTLGSVFTGSAIAEYIAANTFNRFPDYATLSSPSITYYLEGGGTDIVNYPSGNYGNSNNGGLYLYSATLNSPAFKQIWLNNSTYDWKTTSPINIIHMNYDSVLPVINSYQAYSCMKYGRSFAGSGTMPASLGPCNPNSKVDNPLLIASTVVPNFQLTNNLAQMDPTNPSAISKFWVQTPFAAGPPAIPMDHTYFRQQGNIVALCTFESQLQKGVNSGVCPNL